MGTCQEYVSKLRLSGIFLSVINYLSRHTKSGYPNSGSIGIDLAEVKQKLDAAWQRLTYYELSNKLHAVIVIIIA